MWFGPNLQRSYKYMMFSKMPSLRIDQSDLKCKNGCDYFGNPQWQGYCSKCHREQLQRQRRAEKASSTLPKPEQKKPERNFKVTSHSSFSKFEEKRLRQSETLKKANLLKFSVFKKSNTEDHDHVAEKKPAEFKIPAIVNEGMKRDFRLRFPNLTPHIDRDSRLFAHSFIMDVIKHSNILTVDELSERVQRQYQRFMKHMDTSPHFSNVDSDTKELLIDFVEKHSMKYLHELPSVVFSPTGTDDERLDRVMSERIQQLSWVCETHLECKLDRNSASCRQLLYKAISELLGMDAALSPGGKVARVRRACKHVLALCGAPASADDLLPALIFTVLKANPPRLVSNINFVTRFCNAQRLMTGEGGYYFTNLCCAVQFIENLTSESLNMDKKEFDCYMAMPASIGGSAWAAALSLCGASRDAEEQMLQVEKLIAHTKDLKDKADQLANNAETFEKEIAKKVQDVLAKTPLEIKPRRELPRLGSLKTSTSLLEDIDAEKILIEKSLQESTQLGSTESKDNNSAANMAVEIEIPKIEMDNIKNQPTTSFQEEIDHNKFTDTPKIQDEPIITFSQTPEEKSPSKSPINPWELKQTNSLELLTPSPLGFTPFDSRSIDELMTPDDFGSDQVPGLSNVNYDIDLSDLSGDNSLAEDTPREQKDPFSPEPKNFYPFEPRNPFSPILDKFDEFTLIDTKTDQPSDAFEVVHRASSSGDPFSQDINDSFPMEKDGSLLDDSNSPTSTCLLPSPLLPQSSNPN
ncbi:unnamed protein product [Pieris macdunnoughi]|uniref:Rab5 GDP/GTP exchange factor n=1 Tax=Pieris macdunnoughi TaxID=345717 RepID=A0A821RMB7_9NEOP|nr:unnamed protein product [Pieris macdunnoughi]